MMKRVLQMQGDFYLLMFDLLETVNDKHYKTKGIRFRVNYVLQKRYFQCLNTV